MSFTGITSDQTATNFDRNINANVNDACVNSNGIIYDT